MQNIPYKTTEHLQNIRTVLDQYPFIPSRLLKNYHLQIFAFILTPHFLTTTPKVEKRILKVADGNQAVAHCWFQKDAPRKQTIIVVNGFEGYSETGDSKFGTGVGYKAYHAGYNVVILHQRGQGPLVKKSTSIGDFMVEDLPIALQEINTWNAQNKYIVGLSLGAWAAAVAIGKFGENVPNTIKGFVSISAPTNTRETWNHIQKNALYDWFLLQKYKSLIKRRIKIDPAGTWDEAELKKIHTKQQFFETYMHLFGYPEKFSSLDEYFNIVDTVPYLQKFTLPTLIINAQDDPIVPFEPFHNAAIQNNSYVITLLPEHGSHGCFIGSKKYRDDLDLHWAQNRTLQFIQLLGKL